MNTLNKLVIIICLLFINDSLLSQASVGTYLSKNDSIKLNYNFGKYPIHGFKIYNGCFYVCSKKSIFKFDMNGKFLFKFSFNNLKLEDGENTLYNFHITFSQNI